MKYQINRRPQLAWGASLVALALGAGLPTLSAAQGAPAEPSELESVVVTASRIVRDGYEAPTPTTVLGAAEIEKRSPANIADFVNQLPQVGISNSPRTTGVNATNPIGGTNSINLRNLNPQRTLTLLDGRRIAPSAITGLADVNLLPTNLVSRVDVVTGGASAAWGSDAVAGVVNFVLDKSFTGLKGSAGYGLSWRGDAGSWNADLAAGLKFAGGRGHVLLSGRYEFLDGVPRADSRDWYTGYKGIPNPARTTTNGQPGYLAVDRGGLRLATSGGVITSGPLAGIQFGPGGTILPYRFATVGGGITGVGGDVEDVGGDYNLLPTVKSGSVFGRVSFDVTDRVNIYGEFSYGHDYGENDSSHFIRHGDLTIFAENPFIPAGLNLQGLTSFNIGRVQNEEGMGTTRAVNRRDLKRYVFGVDGSASWFNDTFKWNAYYQLGETHHHQAVDHNPIIANFNRAVDVVRNPAVGGAPGIAAGTPVCRSTITDPANGCQPFNVFGRGSPSAASIAYVTGAGAYQDIYLQEDVAAFGFQFDPFSLPAGPVSIAAGAEWRKEQFYNTVDPVDAAAAANAAPFFFGNYKQASGEYSVKEGFAEAIVPLLKDLPFIKSLDANGAVRLTDYTTSGRVTTWKVGGTWDVNEDLRFRGTRSRDIRAPTLGDLFQKGGGGGNGVTQPGTNTQVFVTTVGGGNPNLLPEVADTTAYGVVYRPSWLSGFSLSIDRYDIKIRDAIITALAQQLVDLCYGANGQPPTPAACSTIQLDPAAGGGLAGAIVRIGGANVAAQHVAGYDIEVGYRKALGDLIGDAPGAIDLRAVGTHLTKFDFKVGSRTQDFRDMVAPGPLQSAGGPTWRWLVSATYSLGPSSTTLTARYVGPTVVNNEPRGSALAVDINKVKSVTYFDLNQNYTVNALGADVQLFAQISNLFDKDPPRWASNSGASYAASGTDFTYFDVIGRSWRVGFRFKY